MKSLFLPLRKSLLCKDGKCKLVPAKLQGSELDSSSLEMFALMVKWLLEKKVNTNPIWNHKKVGNGHLLSEHTQDTISTASIFPSQLMHKDSGHKRFFETIFFSLKKCS